MSENFCPKCGTTEGKFFKGFCQNCFLEDHKIVELPEKIEISHCKKCGKVLAKGKWLAQSEQAVKEIILSNLKLEQLVETKIEIKLEQLEHGLTKVLVSIFAKLADEPACFEATTMLVSKEITCTACSLLGANYYEAVLQLRFKEKPQDESAQKMIEEIERLVGEMSKRDSLSKVTGIERAYGGYNIELGSKRAAKKIVAFFENKYNAEIKSSSTLAGVNASGKPKNRHTFLIRV